MRHRRLVHPRLQHRQPRVVPGSEAATGADIRDEGDVDGGGCRRLARASTQTVRAYGRRRQQMRAESRSDGHDARRRDVGAAEAGRRAAELWLSRGVRQAQYQRRRNVPQAVHAGATAHGNDAVATSQGASPYTLDNHLKAECRRCNSIRTA